MSDHRFIVESMTITQETPGVALLFDEYGRTTAKAYGLTTTRMDIGLIFDSEKAVADFARIPEFTAMLGREMDRLGLCRYCGCQLPDDDKPNCSQCGGPRIDRTEGEEP